MLFTTRAIIKYLCKNPKPQTHLGRWEHRQTDKHLDFKQLWANTDHCGDIICGKPELIKKNRAADQVCKKNQKS